METFRKWFSPSTREAIYTVVAAIAPILVTAGVLAPAHVEPVLVIVSAVLQAAAGILALVTLKPVDAARWFGTVGRGVIYAGAVSVAGAVVAMGFITEDFAAGALNYLSMGLTALASIVAVVTPKAVKVSLDEIPVVADAVVVDNAIVEPEVQSHTATAETVAEVRVPVVQSEKAEDFDTFNKDDGR